MWVRWTIVIRRECKCSRHARVPFKALLRGQIRSCEYSTDLKGLPVDFRSAIPTGAATTGRKSRLFAFAHALSSFDRLHGHRGASKRDIVIKLPFDPATNQARWRNHKEEISRLCNATRVCTTGRLSDVDLSHVHTGGRNVRRRCDACGLRHVKELWQARGGGRTHDVSWSVSRACAMIQRDGRAFSATTHLRSCDRGLKHYVIARMRTSYMVIRGSAADCTDVEQVSSARRGLVESPRCVLVDGRQCRSRSATVIDRT